MQSCRSRRGRMLVAVVRLRGRKQKGSVFRFAPESGRRADIGLLPVRARTGLVHCSKRVVFRSARWCVTEWPSLFLASRPDGTGSPRCRTKALDQKIYEDLHLERLMTARRQQSVQRVDLRILCVLQQELVLAGRRFLRLLGSRDRLRGQPCRRCRSRRGRCGSCVDRCGLR